MQGKKHGRIFPTIAKEGLKCLIYRPLIIFLSTSQLYLVNEKNAFILTTFQSASDSGLTIDHI